MLTRPSLAFRKNELAIRGGVVPEKYLRVAACVTGQRVLEVGSAEGVLSLALAAANFEVTGVEKNADRHATALALKEEWCKRGIAVGRCTLVCADIRYRLDLLAGIDTVVAVRSIYYLRDHLPEFFAAVVEHGCREVVLCGNAGRWPRYRDDDARLGIFNYYASLEGMRELLRSIGYEIIKEVATGDPIVVARRAGGAARHGDGKNIAGRRPLWGR